MATTTSDRPAHTLAQRAPAVPDESQTVIEKVLDQLGTPSNLTRVSAVRVWDNHYRVNVYCADETDRAVTTHTITESFFVTMADGGIVSSPRITRKYQSDN